MTEQEVRDETNKHIDEVRKCICEIAYALIDRANEHDSSKLLSPEFPIFVEYTPRLKNTTYGSDEYKQFLVEMKTALDHHYLVNRHHPEYHKKWVCNGCFEEYTQEPMVCNKCGYSQFQVESDISQMNLVDLIEMFCDWKAATLRHNDGDIVKSIEINRKRFGISDQLADILQNTVDVLDKKGGADGF